MFKLLFLLLISFTSTISHAETLTLDKARTVYITGEIGGGIIHQANAVYALALQSQAPVYLVINSPGGSVFAGLQMLSAMQAAKSRGVEFRCVTTLMSASMAFQILAGCDKRYALKHTLLLWHPAKLTTNAPMSSDDMEYNAATLKALENQLNEDLIAALNLSRDVFYYHYKHETLWTANSLKQVSPGFLNIVDDVEGLTELFPGQ